MIRRFRDLTAFLLLVVALATSSCRFGANRNQLRAFEANSAQGRQLMSAGAYAEAAERFQSAFEIAASMSWTDGMVSMRSNLADTFAARGDHPKAIALLEEGLAFCVNRNDCSKEALLISYDGLVFEYLFSLKNGEKVIELSDQIIRNDRDLMSNDEILERLANYVAQMRGANLYADADKLERKIRALHR